MATEANDRFAPSPTGSITGWVRSVQHGDEQAAANLWEQYSVQLAMYARRKLGRSTSFYDEEDVVVSAFHSALEALGKRTYSMNRNKFWALLATVAARKICREVTKSQAQKRVPGCDKKIVSLSEEDIAYCQKSFPPDVAVAFAEQLRNLLDQLPRDDLKTIVTLKLEGHTNREIAAKLNRGLSSIERKLGQIRRHWISML